MPGPCSAPNGDASLVTSTKSMCSAHGGKLEYCDHDCESRQITLREWKLRRNILFSGKTRR